MSSNQNSPPVRTLHTSPPCFRLALPDIKCDHGHGGAAGSLPLFGVQGKICGLATRAPRAVPRHHLQALCRRLVVFFFSQLAVSSPIPQSLCARPSYVLTIRVLCSRSRISLVDGSTSIIYWVSESWPGHGCLLFDGMPLPLQAGWLDAPLKPYIVRLIFSF